MNDSNSVKRPKTRIRCAVSGIVTGCRPDVYDKRVAKYGSEDAMHRSYVCSTAKRELREGHSIDAIREKYVKDSNIMNELPSAMELETIVNDILNKKVQISRKPTKPVVNRTTKAKQVTTAPEVDVVDPDVAAFLNNGKSILEVANV